MSLDPINVKYWKLSHSPDDLGHEGRNDFPCRCDICGDSTWNKSKKRLHLFTKPSFDYDAIKCFNCGWTGNMWSYLKENHSHLYNQYKLEQSSSAFEEILEIKNLEETKSIEEDDLLEPISLDFGTPTAPTAPVVPLEPTPDLVNPLVLPKLSDFPDAVEYLKNRGFDPLDEWLYSTGKIMFAGREFMLKDYIIIPLTWKNGQWYGIQALAWKRKDFRVILLPNNTGWKVWNWDKIDKSKPVYIFESIYDAISSGYKNVIAQLGAQLEQDRIKELAQPIFCLDNQNIDEASVRESMNYLEQGFKVFLWPKGSDNFKDTNDLRKRKVDYSIIQKMIDTNIYQGMQGVLKLKLEY